MNENNQYNITLSDLISAFWEQRAFISIVTLICFGLSLGYLCFINPVYEAKTSITRPARLDLLKLNAGAFHEPNDSFLKKYSIDQVYAIYIENLLSEETKREFFDTTYWPSLQFLEDSKLKEQAYLQFLTTLIIREDNYIKNNYKISFTAASSQEAQMFIAKYLELVQTKFKNELTKDFRYRMQAKLSNIKFEIEYIEQLSKKYNNDELFKLNKALLEAKSEKLDHYLPPSPNNTHFELFALGTQVLGNRINAIKSQKINSTLLPKYRKLQVDYSFYSNAQKLFQKIHFYKLDKPIYASVTPISPKKNLVLMVGILSGLLLGSIRVYIQMVRNYKHIDTNKSPSLAWGQ